MQRVLTHLLPGAVSHTEAPVGIGQTDPFDSGMWPLHRRDLLGDPVNWRYDETLTLLAPDAAEDAMHVPFLVDATAIAQVERLVVTIDYSPIPVALTFHPRKALPLIGFAVKYESGSPLRVSMKLADGTWRMATRYVHATGGGCTAPAAAHGRPDWQQGFGDFRARLWPETGRLRVWFRHPQDTGLAPGIAAHYITSLTVLDDNQDEVLRVEMHEPIEENPALTFLLPEALLSQSLKIQARDNLGYRFGGVVEAVA